MDDKGLFGMVPELKLHSRKGLTLVKPTEKTMSAIVDREYEKTRQANAAKDADTSAGGGKFKCRYPACEYHKTGFQWPGQLAGHLHTAHKAVKNYGRHRKPKATKGANGKPKAGSPEYQRAWRKKRRSAKKADFATLTAPQTNGHARPPMPFRHCPDCATPMPLVEHRGIQIPQAVNYCFQCGYKMPLVNL